MNMMAGISAAQCPYCGDNLGQWVEPRSTHICASCERPLGRMRASRKVRLYRIMPMFNLTRIAGTVITIVAIISAIATQGKMAEAVLMIALALGIYGLTDIADGWLAVKSKIDRLGSTFRQGRSAQRIGWMKLLFGLATIAIALLGIMTWSSITSSM